MTTLYQTTKGRISRIPDRLKALWINHISLATKTLGRGPWISILQDRCLLKNTLLPNLQTMITSIATKTRIKDLAQETLMKILTCRLGWVRGIFRAKTEASPTILAGHQRLTSACETRNFHQSQLLIGRIQTHIPRFSIRTFGATIPAKLQSPLSI